MTEAVYVLLTHSVNISSSGSCNHIFFLALFDDCVINSERGRRGIIFNLLFNLPQRGVCLQYEHREF